MNGKQNGLTRSTTTYVSSKSRSFDRRGGGDHVNDGSYGSPSTKSTWNKNSGGSSSSSNGNAPSRKRSTHRRNSEMSSVIREVEGDLFTASAEYSLAHCVAEDFRMGAGIAVHFRYVNCLGWKVSRYTGY